MSSKREVNHDLLERLFQSERRLRKEYANGGIAANEYEYELRRLQTVIDGVKRGVSK